MQRASDRRQTRLNGRLHESPAPRLATLALWMQRASDRRQTRLNGRSHESPAPRLATLALWMQRASDRRQTRLNGRFHESPAAHAPGRGLNPAHGGVKNTIFLRGRFSLWYFRLKSYYTLHAGPAIRK
jgi:hypothetical protein